MRAHTAHPAVVAIVVLLTACGGGGGGGKSTPSATTNPPSPSPSTATQTTTTTTQVSQIPQASPDAAAVAVLNAWRAGDRAAAARVATPTAIATLFAQPPQGFSSRGCQDPLAGRSACSFGIGGGLVDVNTVTLAGGWLVDGVTFL